MGGLKKCVIEAKNKKRAANRPAKEIDWDMVDSFLISGSPGTEIAALFDMHKDTFYGKFEKHHGVCFTVYCQERRSKGDALLRRQQFLKALGKSTDGDNTMLVWLGKNRLGQSESPTLDAVSEIKNQFDALMTQVTNLQKEKMNSQSEESSLSIDESNNSNEA